LGRNFLHRPIFATPSNRAGDDLRLSYIEHSQSHWRGYPLLGNDILHFQDFAREKLALNILDHVRATI
jgi:hypothetical protein